MYNIHNIAFHALHKQLDQSKKWHLGPHIKVLLRINGDKCTAIIISATINISSSTAHPPPLPSNTSIKITSKIQNYNKWPKLSVQDVKVYLQVMLQVVSSERPLTTGNENVT